jgi:hypothetical protein
MSDIQEVVLLLALLGLKHFIIDFPLQKEYQWKNKGTYGHPGGLVHAGLHGIGTFIVLSFFLSPAGTLFLSLFDSVAHYHIDWAKMRLNDKFKWGPTTHEQFRTLVGFDQFLHWLTYVAIIGWITGAI